MPPPLFASGRRAYSAQAKGVGMRLITLLLLSGAVAGCTPSGSDYCTVEGGAECFDDHDCGRPGEYCNLEQCRCDPLECGAADDECAEDAECPAGQICEPDGCTCVPECGPEAECDGDADCGEREYCDLTECACVHRDCRKDLDECEIDADCGDGGRCDQATCRCEGGSALTPGNLATFTATGQTASCAFTAERDCAVGTFSAQISFRAGADGSVELVQLPGSQTTLGAFVGGVRFFTRDSGSAYDEIYLAEFQRTAGTDPTAPLTRETVEVRALNASGADGSLATIDEARIGAALSGGAHLDGGTAAIDAFLAGTSGVCTYLVHCTFPP